MRTRFEEGAFSGGVLRLGGIWVGVFGVFGVFGGGEVGRDGS